MPDMPWREAIIEVLRREGAAMHYTAIAERVVADGLREAVGATPASTVNAVITTSLNSDGERSPFQRVARGEYVLRPALDRRQALVALAPRDEALDEVEGPIHAFGMFWDRDRVRWTANPAVLGRQQIGADAVDMAGQRGVYLLYDGREVVYVGRCTDRSLGTRLYEPTTPIACGHGGTVSLGLGCAPSVMTARWARPAAVTTPSSSSRQWRQC